MSQEDTIEDDDLHGMDKLRKPKKRHTTQWDPPSDDLEITKVVTDSWPYKHSDVWAEGPDGEEYVFGIPENHEEGMAFYLIREDGALKQEETPAWEGTQFQEMPECPFHPEADVKPTKIFQVANGRIQFKCPKCYLTRYRGGNGE